MVVSRSTAILYVFVAFAVVPAILVVHAVRGGTRAAARSARNTINHNNEVDPNLNLKDQLTMSVTEEQKRWIDPQTVMDVTPPHFRGGHTDSIDGQIPNPKSNSNNNVNDLFPHSTQNTHQTFLEQQLHQKLTDDKAAAPAGDIPQPEAYQITIIKYTAGFVGALLLWFIIRRLNPRRWPCCKTLLLKIGWDKFPDIDVRVYIHKGQLLSQGEEPPNHDDDDSDELEFAMPQAPDPSGEDCRELIL
jgi:hypothetical protein